MASSSEDQLPLRTAAIVRHNVRPKIAIQPIKLSVSRPNRKLSKPKKASSPDPDIVETAKKRRISARKSRQGCRTCKARHHKCDETRPSCLRCVSAGWACDYTEPQKSIEVRNYVFPMSQVPRRGAWSSLPEDRPTPPLPAFNNVQDAQYLHYIWGQFCHNPACAFEVPLWAVLLQMCHQEACIKQIMLGMAKIHQIYRPIVNNPSDPSYIEMYRAGFRHYIRAVQALKTRLASVKGKPDRTTWEVALFTSFLFAGFEVLVGNEDGAWSQMEKGFTLMASVLAEYGSNNLPGNLEELTCAWNRIDLQAATYSLGCNPHSLRSPTIANKFHTTYDAKNALERIIPSIVLFIRSKGPEFRDPRLPTDPLPKDMATELADLNTILRNWSSAFDELLRSLNVDLNIYPVGQKQIKYRTAYYTLMVQYWAAFVMLNTPFSHTQTMYDVFLPTFITIVDLAENLLAMNPDKKDYYVADTAIIQPLAYLGRKCRDGKIRRRAIQLLKIAGREGVWDGQCQAIACEWIMDKEEEGLSEGEIGNTDPMSPSFVEEKFRLRRAAITVNRLGKSLRIACSRRREDGIEEMVEGNTGWGEVGSIVYGEFDKMWQDGGLFG